MVIAVPAVPAPSAPASLSALLDSRLSDPRYADQLALRFLVTGDVGDAVLTLTRAELHQKACAIAAELGRICRPGERALLLYLPGLDFIAAFLGCLYAGVLAVPLPPPMPNELTEGARRIARIAEDCAPLLVLSTRELHGMAEPFLQSIPALARLRWLLSDQVDEEGSFVPISRSRSHLAFLQYTSGSTGDPKGVMVSHGNLLANLANIERPIDPDNPGTGVSWIPHFHDMGLIGCILFPLSRGMPATLMSPLAFLQKPQRWLAAISHYRANGTMVPQFALDLAVRKTPKEALAELDLSCLEVLAVGAEPIRPSTLRRFLATFTPRGLRPSSLLTCYGLAEGTLVVSTGGSRSELPIRSVDPAALERGELREVSSGGREIVGCGSPQEELILVDPENGELAAPGRCGEVWLRGPSVARGYYGDPERTAEIFGAYVNGEGPYLRTGDLGVLYKGDLFLTGRHKDLIIQRGRNLYPQDIETTVESIDPSLRPGRTVAVSLDDNAASDEERLVILSEIDPDRCPQGRDGIETLLAEVARKVAEEHGVVPYALLALPARSVPVTTSGKVRRREARRRFLDGELAPLGRWPAVDAAPVVAPARAAARSPERASTQGALVFLLSSERSGSTLLRVMLSAHPQLFSPPELNLAPYVTLAERSRALPQGQTAGLLRALVELDGLGADAAERAVAEWERTGQTPREVYAHFLKRLPGRVLVDKSPLNSKHPQGLRRVLDWFGTRTRFIHLVRHPYAMIDSYARLGLEQLLRDQLPARLSPHAAAEISWLESSRNNTEFLAELPANRHCLVRYEDLVADPEAVMRRLCAFLEVPFDPVVLAPYQHGRMTDPVRAGSLDGDPNFHQHESIEAHLAEAWRTLRLPHRLGPETQRLARRFGYELPVEDRAVPASPLAVSGSAVQEAAQEIRHVIAAALSVQVDAVPVDRPFFAFGFDSLRLIQLTQALENRLGRPIEAQSLFNHPTIEALALHLVEVAPQGSPASDPVLALYDTLPPALAGGNMPSRYQFDLEADICWARIREPGLYLPDSLLAQAGIEVGALRRVPQAYDVFQWAAALGMCSAFELFEWGLLEFCHREEQALGDTRRLHALRSEEEKHIQLFRRYASHLRSERPELCGIFDACARDAYGLLKRLFDPAVPEHLHYQIWINTLFFETFTLHLARVLAGTGEPIQPTWLAAHQAHAREEAHHVVTGDLYTSSLLLGEPQRAALSTELFAELDGAWLQLFGATAAVRLVRECHGLDCLIRSPLRLSDTPFFAVVKESPAFGLVRKHIPAIGSAGPTPAHDSAPV